MVADGSRSSCGFYHVLPHSRAGTLGPCGIFGQRCAQVCFDISTRWNSLTPLRENGKIKMILIFSLPICDGLNTMVWQHSSRSRSWAPSLECRGGHRNILEPVEIKLIQAVFHLVVEAMWRAWLELEGVGVRQSWTEASLSWFRSFIGRRARKGENFHKECHIRSCFIGNCWKLHCLLVC